MPASVENALPRLNDLIRQYCSPEWKELLRERNIVLEFRKGERLFESGQLAERMFMIESGGVKVTADIGEGSERIIRLVGRGEVVGHRAIGDEPVYSATATALNSCRVNSIPMGLFLSTLKANGVFCYHFLLFFAAEMRRLDIHMRDMMSMDVTQRVAKVLKLNMDTFGFDAGDRNKLAFTLSRRDIANAAGTTYESVIRVLSDMQRRGIIGIVGKEIRIRDRSALSKLLKL